MNSEIKDLVRLGRTSRDVSEWKELLNAMRSLIEDRKLERAHSLWWEMEQIVSIASFRKREITPEEWEELDNYLNQIESTDE